MTKLLTAVIASLLIASLAQAQGASELEDIMRLADERRQVYIETFKNLTSTETQATEAFDRNGKVEKRRTVVSDFLVYRSDLGSDHNDVMEFRVVREVDGKLVANSTENAIALFQRLAKTNTLTRQRDQLIKAYLKYALGYATFGYTLGPWFRTTTQSDLEFAVAGRERIAGRDAIVVAYILHWVNETIVVDRQITTPVTFARTEIDYEPSAFGVWTPRKIVASIFRKAEDKKAPVTYEEARITFTYEPFKRFEVTTQTDIQAPR